MSLIWVFPGQGTQKRGMGREWFDRFSDRVAEADDLLGYSIRRLCLEDPDSSLSQTDRTQPALFVVSSLAYLARLEDGEERPDWLAGHSLGECTALFAAGAFDFATGVRLTRQRGELMARERGGGMIAVLGWPAEKLRNFLKEERFDAIDLANLNAPRQTVLSGREADIARCSEALKRARARVVPLKVSGAFHSRYLRSAQDEFARRLKEVRFASLRIPVIANATARPYEDGEVRETLARQMSSPLRWTDTVEWLLRRPDPSFKEIGPGRVLTGLIRQIKAERRESGTPAES